MRSNLPYLQPLKYSRTLSQLLLQYPFENAVSLVIVLYLPQRVLLAIHSQKQRDLRLFYFLALHVYELNLQGEVSVAIERQFYWFF